jgi:hypothetical protein
MAKVMKAWALCHRGTPLVIYTQWTRKQVQSECATHNSVIRVEVHVPEPKKRAATNGRKAKRAAATVGAQRPSHSAKAEGK